MSTAREFIKSETDINFLVCLERALSTVQLRQDYATGLESKVQAELQICRASVFEIRLCATK
ncbi:MAG: hypothetical protein EBR09_08510 [Proteobacteria bacterium]|nr:hypothetical protein [Pseudomonadota bacterium]